MKKLILFLFVLFCVINVFGEQRANVPICNTSPVIDGILDDDCYKNSLLISNLLVLSNSAVENNRDKIYITRDRENLYIGMDVFAPNIKCKKVNERDTAIWEDDAVEVYIRPFLESEDYYVFILNGGNSLYDGFKMEGTWNSNAQYASVKTETGWTGEIGISLKELGLENPSEIGFNVAREDPTNKQYYTWSNLNGQSFHSPLKFGFLTFNDSVGTYRLDNIELVENIINITGTDKYNYIISKGNETYKGKGNIKAKFKDTKGLFNVSFFQGEDVVFSEDFNIVGSVKTLLKTDNNILKVSVDMKNIIINQNTKFILKVTDTKELGPRVYYGESLRIDKPCMKNFEYDISSLPKGKYIVDIELWGPVSRISLNKETFEIK